MKVLVTGANGYIGRRLLPVLAEAGHTVVGLVRHRAKLTLPPHLESKVEIIEGDLLKPETLVKIPDDIEVAYYLVHSMTHTGEDFSVLEKRSATNFIERMERTATKQIIYLGGLVNDPDLSQHLLSRRRVEDVLRTSRIPLTVLRAGIIIGSGSASFEIIRDLVEKLPVLIAPKWVRNFCQPIAIADVIYYLTHVVFHPECFNQTFDIGGPEVLTYREMLLRFGTIRGLHRFIFDVPVFSPRLSSYWLYFVTSTNFSLAQSLVSSLKNQAVCRDQRILSVIPHDCLSFEESVKRAFTKIQEQLVISSWKDSWVTSELSPDLREYVRVPEFGCLFDRQVALFSVPLDKVEDEVFSIGGDRGWTYMMWAWRIRGYIDKIVGGVGLRRGRTHPTELKPGDALDFWRVILADRTQHRLLLYAEMRLPGEAWLEFHLVPREEGGLLIQTATFRPAGVAGRLYWYGLFPFHWFIFRGLIRSIVKRAVENGHLRRLQADHKRLLPMVSQKAANDDKKREVP